MVQVKVSHFCSFSIKLEDFSISIYIFSDPKISYTNFLYDILKIFEYLKIWKLHRI